MEDYDDLVSDHSGNEEAYYSDRVDSDIEAELYGLIHHDAQDNSVSLQEKSDSVDIKSVSLQDKSDSIEVKSVSLQKKSDSTKNNSILPQNSLVLTNDNSILSQNSLVPTNDNSFLPLTSSVTSKNIVNSTKKLKNAVKKNNQNYSTPVQINHTDLFSSDTIVNDNLYYSFESPVRKQKIQQKQKQIENSKRNIIPTPAKRKSDVVSEILENIQLKKNRSLMQPKNSVSKQKKNKPDHSAVTTEGESFVEVIEDSSDSDSNSSIMLLEPDQSSLQTNITKETVLLSSDSEDSVSSMEMSFFQACQRKPTEISNTVISPNDKDPWHINPEDKFRTKKQSNRYHENAVVTCSKCQLKGHSAKFCSVPKAMKCFYCGDYHSGMNCKNKICTNCLKQGHDRRRCYVRSIDTCELCHMRGHSERNCPDIWRRYHLTTSNGSIVKGSPDPHSPLYCFNCGSKGHYGAECIVTRINRWNFPTWTSVISYKNPISALQREMEKDFQQCDRNYQQQGRNFQQPERNFQQERNFHERSRFDRTPLFHRRKGNEKFSKETPTENAKKKKKKKSPKTPPSTDQQSTTWTNNIVQNEVYFPRTPKVTPRSSRGRLWKKKLKKSGSKEDRILEAQMMHRIGLQQRLGLPFPSTV